MKDDKMLRKLRIQFVVIAMIMLVVMQTVIIYISAAGTYNRMVRKADHLVNSVYENITKADTIKEENSEDNDNSDSIDNSENIDARYFYVILNDAGEVEKINNINNRSVKPKAAVKMYRDVAVKDSKEGFYNGYRYKIYNEDSKVIAIFVLRSSMLEDVKRSIVSLIQASVAGVAVMFIILIYISKRMVKPIAVSYQKQKEFITSASHELKTPITVIRADVDILQMDDEDNEWLADIKKQAENLTTMTNSLVSLARIDERNGNIKKIAFPISDLANEIVSSYNAVSIDTDKKFTYEINPGISCCGDAASIRQLFTILLDNAFKYSTKEGNIYFSLASSGNNIIITVKNDVDNIEENQTERMFDRFYRADSTSAKVTGFGLGLSIAKAIVAEHNGNIHAKAENNQLTINATLRTK